ncbi:HEAT repeat domain-containing protein [Pontibacter sp. HSC-36F09]|uniref:HEAT repeat domain-containing protein n=1 Tax=Pontibacter sp. HSC-36F09 TaxID=2910966 RepID=UPI00209FA446|nr:HEAT repeat domain-containing protein [Pontibacter sp. HSC-36F09]MCP2045680.1 HEAT repeat protein [Pontibacter sp. HSC-36F09]
MEEYLLNLIERMGNDSGQNNMEAVYDSSKTISWKAFREAEKQDNESYIPQLMEFIEKEKNKKKKDRAYFLLGHIAKNTGNIVAVKFLIQQVEKETDKYVVSALLDIIAYLKKPNGMDLQPILNAMKSEKWLIRHSAISALKESSDEEVENALVEVLNNSTDPNDLTYANATLNKVGTPKAIPYIKNHLRSRKRDVKLSAKLAIEEIEKRYKSTKSTDR